MKLTDFKILTFDCYGTLIDWETGMVNGLAPLTARAKEPLSRNQILEAHARHESAQQRWTPARRYDELLAVVYKRLAEEWGVAASWEEALAYGRSIKDWPAFADTAGALQYLKKYYKLAILSNVDNASFALSNVRLQVEFDAIFTAEDIGSYKPSHRNFQYMLEKLDGLGIARGEILHTAESLFHDHVPAKAAGLATCWIHRRHAEGGFGATMPPESEPNVDFRFTSMADLAKAHQEALRG
ncbi:haloacid dehalogenase type II [Inquilinus limosus]|uniref:haloacid dehalogenase type II n=1 Tax=Inquilinus limosus TaxID=171674 RepID=UPI0004789EDA|nr:haloacid dehalogenase type II [Inquilinus limosus]